MSKNWMIDLASNEIKLKKRTWFIQLFHFITCRRYTVRELYIFIYNEFHAPDKIAGMMSYSYPIDHDNIKKPKGVPFNYVMQGGWTIPESSLKKLIKGPLISEHGYALLVKADTTSEIAFRTVLKVIGWLTIPGGLFGTWEFLKYIFKYL
ncbi:hypothetical protein ACEZ3G_06370 [Maribacter algicola]|uniref:Uncharacterized protein n=1 Tax=Meishania litoralis TaxID=3434685 RepID=A0ACC7LHU6_9FLAO